MLMQETNITVNLKIKHRFLWLFELISLWNISGF